MSLTYRVVTTGLRGLTGILCRVRGEALKRVPDRGPLILVANHVNFLEAPVIYTRLDPRPVCGFAKAETWDNPLLGRLGTLWNAIPLQRGEADVGALREGLKALEAGRILIVTPEGHRSGDGRLLAGKPGVALLALHSRAPLLPMAYWGGERFWENIRRLRRTDFQIAVGRPFTVEAGGVRVTREGRQQIVDEIMYQLAGLLPAEYRGVYGDLSAATQTYLRFA